MAKYSKYFKKIDTIVFIETVSEPDEVYSVEVFSNWRNPRQNSKHIDSEDFYSLKEAISYFDKTKAYFQLHEDKASKLVKMKKPAVRTTAKKNSTTKRKITKK